MPVSTGPEPLAKTPPQSPSSPTPPAEPVRLDFDATLKAFLDAPDWKARSQYVMIPDQVGDLMELRAKASGDGPVPVTEFSLAFIDHDNHTYSVRTKTMPEAFPVTVMPTADGPKVDWESFAGFSEDDFRKFSEGPVGASGVFHLIVRPDPPAESDAETFFLRFRLSVPMPNREQISWAARKSSVTPALRKIFDGEGPYTREQVKDYVAKGGLPMVLGLEKKTNGSGQDFLEITEFISLGWGPGTE